MLFSRRDILRSGSGAFVLLVTGLPSCRVRGHAAGAIVCDPALCSGCGRCAITCSSLNLGGPSGVALVGPDPVLLEQGAYDLAAVTCHQCPEVVDASGRLTEPACVAVCPTGAARIAERGHPVYGNSRVRYVNADDCIGCGSCVAACPFDHPLIRDGRSHKCDGCIGTWDEPPCVDACPSSALTWQSPWSDTPPRPFPWEHA